MPELPEVETVVRALRKTAVGAAILAVKSDTHQLFESRKIFKSISSLLQGDSITSIGRRGKYILFYLSSGRVLVAHMKMTGHFLLESGIKNYELRKYIRAEINFTNGTKLLFSDVRKFGRFWIVPKEKLDEFFSQRKLAHDALSPLCTKEYFRSQIKRNRAVKTLLLDQTCVAGVGNIYADEALWLARINPNKKGNRLTRAEAGRLYEALQHILKEGIKAGGASTKDYRRPDGSRGYFQMQRAAYGRENEPCRRCQTKITRQVIAQRSAHFCLKCQAA
ncbi:MAG: DNA-formamidopyrimidine glycosylase [Candidatus Sungbacteria bacterium]|uniref:DNA-formamidopyrimidine glycosylase n=1 Tax=Candidatus Sungiibacteriota bacterium TaxID=2750080 RepID=A0A9D6LTH3_9BACT|nr:DNA-formamidopyrimidine glycosylase [Candidatus Sungbacteria bacterium]